MEVFPLKREGGVGRLGGRGELVGLVVDLSAVDFAGRGFGEEEVAFEEEKLERAGFGGL